MPKATLQFNLPEEQSEFNDAINASKVKGMLWDFSQQLREWYKYHHNFQNADDALDKIREEFYRLLNEHNIDMDV